jgi:hypothetical protein
MTDQVEMGLMLNFLEEDEIGEDDWPSRWSIA